jgi:hypothetical protein
MTSKIEQERLESDAVYAAFDSTDAEVCAKAFESAEKYRMKQELAYEDSAWIDPDSVQPIDEYEAAEKEKRLKRDATNWSVGYSMAVLARKNEEIETLKSQLAEWNERYLEGTLST